MSSLISNIFRSKKKDVLELLSVEEDDLQLPMSVVVVLRLQRSVGGDLQRRKNAGVLELAQELQRDVVENAQFPQKKNDDLEAARRRRNQGGKKRKQGELAADRDADDRDRIAQTHETKNHASQRNQRETRKSEK